MGMANLAIFDQQDNTDKRLFVNQLVKDTKIGVETGIRAVCKHCKERKRINEDEVHLGMRGIWICKKCVDFFMHKSTVLHNVAKRQENIS